MRCRKPGAARVLAAVFLAVSAVVATGCGSGSITDAYDRVHPGFVDGPLQPALAQLETVVADIRKDLDPAREIWLPEYLPAGFVLAAPYNGDGSGSAYPNPYAWGRGYSVTYTDGTGYVMVLANSDDDLTQGEWSPLAESLAGRALRLQRGPGMVLVATVDDGGPPLLVSGGGFGGDRLEAELIQVAGSLSRRQ
jgi:hypothetical protein